MHRAEDGPSTTTPAWPPEPRGGSGPALKPAEGSRLPPQSAGNDQRAKRPAVSLRWAGDLTAPAALRRDAHPRAAGCAWPAPRAPRRDRIEDRGTGAHALRPGTAARHRPAPAAPAGEFGTSGGPRHLFHSFTQSTNVCGRLGCARRVTCRARRSPGKHLHSSVTETFFLR